MSITIAGGISLVPAQKEVSVDWLREQLPDARTIVAVDFYIEGAEHWERIPGGWKTEVDGVTIINIDHHAPAAEMMRFVSSGNLAAEYLKTNEVFTISEGVVVVINHCDADSITASSMLVGIIQPEARFEEAVLAADHSGAGNYIADALQALEQKRDLHLSLSTLALLRDGAELTPAAKLAFEERTAERAALESLLKQEPALLHDFGAVVVLEARKRIPAEMLPALLPKAVVILASAPMDAGRYQIKARLGAAAPDGTTLFSLGLTDFDAAFGGRWNAGSNKRGGGTLLSPSEYGKQLAAVVSAHL